MKTPVRTFLAAAVLAGAFNLAATAQTNGAACQPAAAAGERGQQLRERAQKIAEELGLTPEQKEQLKPLVQAQMQKLRALHSDTSLSRPEKMEKFKELRQAAAPQFKAILTEEQWQKVQQKMEERRANRGSQQGAGAARPQA